MWLTFSINLVFQCGEESKGKPYDLEREKKDALELSYLDCCHQINDVKI